MRGFRAVDRGRAKRRRTRGRMRRGSLACVKTLREKYTLPNGSTSASPKTGSALRRAAARRAGRRWKARRRTMPQRQANGEPTWQSPATARACKGNEHRKGTAGNRGKTAARKARGKWEAQRRRRGSGAKSAKQGRKSECREKPAPGKPERTRNGRSRKTDVRPSPRVGGDAAGSGRNRTEGEGNEG